MTRDARDALQRHTRQLEALAEQVARGPYWPERQKRPRSYTMGYLRSLLALCTMADGTVAWYEIVMLHEYHADDMPWEEEARLARETAERSGALLTEAPPFFVAACRADATDGTDVGRRMQAAILGFCQAACVADGRTDGEETDLLEKLTVALERARGQVAAQSSSRA